MSSACTVLALATLCYLLTGCITRPKPFADWQREDSFKSARSLMVGQESLRNYLSGRSALVANAKHIDLSKHTITGKLSTKLEFSGPSRPSFGTAAAIDSRGYYITAAHCVPKEDTALIIPSSNGADLAKKARVVWSGYKRAIKMDFAILHVPATIEKVFQWQQNSEFQDGEYLFSTGALVNKGKRAQIDLTIEPVGGNLVKVETIHLNLRSYERLYHDSPLVPGNSGGPIVNYRGNLLGVNVTGPRAKPVVKLPATLHSSAVMPDVEWVKALINRDAKKHSF